MTIGIDVRYFAAAAAGVGQSSDRREYEAPVTIGGLLADVERSAGTADEKLGVVLGRCSFIVNGVTTRDRDLQLVDGDQLDVLPPFAGG